MCKICDLREAHVYTKSDCERIIPNRAAGVLQEKKFHLSFCYILASTHIADLTMVLDNPVPRGFMLSYAMPVLFCFLERVRDDRE
jgi:hypothetical protein